MLNFLKNQVKFVFCVVWFSYLIISIQNNIEGEIKLSRQYGELNFKYLLHQVRMGNPLTSEHKEMIELEELCKEYQESCKQCDEIDKKYGIVR